MYLNGLTTGIAGHNPTPGKRGDITGWTHGAVRRHTAWLYSVDAGGLEIDGEVGYAVTLTLRDLPRDHDDWMTLRKHWLQAVRRAGAVRVHWVVEWQRRGVPHLHGAVYFPAGTRFSLHGHDDLPGDTWLVLSWLSVASRYGAVPGAQHVKPITAMTGWGKYLSKHASRGVKHYQRNGKPNGWQKTGRLWGHTGDWPVVEPLTVDLVGPEYHRFRRLVRSWRIADARAAGDWRRLVHARTMLKSRDRNLASVRGLSDWVPIEVSARLAALAQSA